MTEIRMTVPGRPVPWGRIRTNHGRFFKDKRTREYEESVAWECRMQNGVMGGADCWIEIEFSAEMTLRGDIDNYAKAVLDGLQIGGMIENDKQVKKLTLSFGTLKEDVTKIVLRPYEGSTL